MRKPLDLHPHCTPLMGVCDVGAGLACGQHPRCTHTQNSVGAGAKLSAAQTCDGRAAVQHPHCTHTAPTLMLSCMTPGLYKGKIALPASTSRVLKSGFVWVLGKPLKIKQIQTKKKTQHPHCTHSAKCERATT